MSQGPTIRDALAAAAARLERRRLHAPRLTAEVLLGGVLGRGREFLYAHPEDALSPEQAAAFDHAVGERLGGIPTQYITGRQEFYGLNFSVAPGVFIPRPETELVVEQALASISAGDRVVDVCSGSGCVAIAIQAHRRSAKVIGAELTPGAIAAARRNAEDLKIPIEFLRADLLSPFSDDSADVVVSNPPYIPLSDLPGLQQEVRAEPPEALFGGQDGLAIYRRLIPEAQRVLVRGGRMILELGYRSRPAVEALLDPRQWEDVEVHRDLAGLDRVIAARKRRE